MNFKNLVSIIVLLASQSFSGMEQAPQRPQQSIASLERLPIELFCKILYTNARADGVLNMTTFAQGVRTLADVNKALRDHMNRNIFAILQSLPTYAGASYLAEKLEERRMPCMQRKDIKGWLESIMIETAVELEKKQQLRTAILLTEISVDTTAISRILAHKAIDLTDSFMHAMSVFNNKTKEIFTLLLDAGADLNRKDNYGNAPLMRVAFIGEKDFEETYHITLYSDAQRQAAHARQKELADLLLKAGANPDIMNNAGETAYDLALEENNTQVAELLATASAERKARLAQRTSSKRKH